MNFWVCVSTVTGETFETNRRGIDIYFVVREIVLNIPGNIREGLDGWVQKGNERFCRLLCLHTCKDYKSFRM